MDRVYVEERAPRDFLGAGRPSFRSRSSCWYGKKPPSESDYDLREREQILYRVPRGYSVRHWDSSEKPIVVGATVFDSNSFGKWIFDWSVFSFGSASRAADVAGELWLGLIRLSAKLSALEAFQSGSKAERVVKGDGIALWDCMQSLVRSCQSGTERCIRKDRCFVNSEAVASQFVRNFFRPRGRMDAVERFVRSLRRWEAQFVGVYGNYIRLVFSLIGIMALHASFEQVIFLEEFDFFFDF